MNAGLEELAKRLLQECGALRGAVIHGIDHLAGDASGRRFFRLHLGNAAAATLVMLLYPLDKGPGLVGGLSGEMRQGPEEVFIEIAEFFRAHGIYAPQVISFSKSDRALLIEDIGSQPLWRFAKNELDEAGEQIKDGFGEGWLEALFGRAIGVTRVLQTIKPEAKIACFTRFLAFDNYRRELEEFLRFYAEPRGLKRAAKGVFEKSFDALAETMAGFPRTLVHFDFTAYNLFAGPGGEIRVIDFQDACLASPARDIVSLINDRCMDETLGRTLHARLLAYYYNELKCGPEFCGYYDTTLLHWDFRVSGRFVKLCETMRTEFYRQFIPGTLRRLGRTLLRTHQTMSGLSDVLEILHKLSPEVREGLEDPWPLPEFRRKAAG